VSRKTIIACAVTGSGDTVQKNPAVPVTPAQIAQSAIEAAKAGAAIVHIHVRDPNTGKASMDFELYKETVERIRNSGIDVIINLTTGAGARFSPDKDNPRQPGTGTTLCSPAERVRHVLALRPEICSLDMGSMNMGEHVFVNTPGHLSEMARAIRDAGVRPELEVFEAGHIRLSSRLIEAGDIRSPALFQICLGVPWAQPATGRAMQFMVDLLPPNSTWFAFGISAQQFPMVAQAWILGGNVRVGLEDNLWVSKGVLASSNAALVEKAAHIIEQLGGAVATTAEARQILALN